MSEEKTCLKCGEPKPLAEFVHDRTRSDGHFPYCKPCHAAYQKRYPAKPIPWEEFTPEQQERKVAQARESRYRRVYGITIEDYDRVLAYQGGRCAICGAKPRAGGRRMHCDHDHATGQFRGILCHRCNTLLLGRYATPANLERAADYLNSPTAVEALGEPRFGQAGPTKKRRRRRRRKT